MGCSALCIFYLFGLFNAPILEVLHEVSHLLAPKTHHHGFFTDHEAVDYSPLEAMAGHSHEALEDLKNLLEANYPDEKGVEGLSGFKFHKHFQTQSDFEIFVTSFKDKKAKWFFFSTESNGFPQTHLPPPKNS